MRKFKCTAEIYKNLIDERDTIQIDKIEKAVKKKL